jgi:hypothetical protein
VNRNLSTFCPGWSCSWRFCAGGSGCPRRSCPSASCALSTILICCCLLCYYFRTDIFLEDLLICFSISLMTWFLWSCYWLLWLEVTCRVYYPPVCVVLWLVECPPCLYFLACDWSPYLHKSLLCVWVACVQVWLSDQFLGGVRTLYLHPIVRFVISGSKYSFCINNKQD